VARHRKVPGHCAGLSSQAASQPLTDAVTVVQKRPGTLAAVQAGVLSWEHAGCWPTGSAR
jgi:hypothetical protein